MRYTDADCAYKLLGVYHIQRNPREKANLPRNFIGIGHRIKGSSTFFFDGGSLYAGDGSTLFLPDNTAFRNCNTQTEELVIVHLQPMGKAPGQFRLYPDTQELSALFWKLYNAWESGQYNRCMATLYEIFDGLEKPETDAPPVIAPGVALLRQRFRDPGLTIAEAAESCFVSQVYFRRVYRQHYGTAPLQDLLQWRFDYARQLLRSGYYKTQTVADMSGFSDVKYFRTAFTKRFGCSPTQWAAKNKK